MTPPATGGDGTVGEQPASERAIARQAGQERARQRRRAEVFGDVLPQTTGDERADEPGERDGGTDDWLRRQVPPHHG